MKKLSKNTINAIKTHAEKVGFEVYVEMDAYSAFNEKKEYFGLSAISIFERGIDSEPVGFFITDGTTYTWKKVYAGEQNKVANTLTACKSIITDLAKELNK